MGYTQQHCPHIIKIQNIPGNRRIQILRAKCHVSSVDLSEASKLIGDAETWSTKSIINLELDQADEAAHNPNENFDIEDCEGLTE